MRNTANNTNPSHPLKTTRIHPGVYQVNGTNAYIQRMSYDRVGASPAASVWTLQVGADGRLTVATFDTKREALQWLWDNPETAGNNGVRQE